MPSYYNENDLSAAAWLRELIRCGLIAPGEVDTRSIKEVHPDDLREFTQCHFFAGIGVWSYALRSAGWPDDRPIWTGSCPCQPFSAAGKRAGQSDDRHLWPSWFRLIRECRPTVIFGEQVSSAGVIGPASVQGVRRNKRNNDVSLAQRSRPQVDMQVVREQGRSRDQAVGNGNAAQISEIGQASSPRHDLDERREAACKNKENSVLTELERNSEAYRRRILRSDGAPIRSEDAVRMERSISGSGSPVSGLYDGEHEGRSLRPELHGRDLGSGEGSGNRRSNSCEGRLNESFGEDRAPLNGNDGRAWLDLVFDDLEAASYTCGAVSFPACGVGAPHIRQRLYWVADSGGPRLEGRDPREVGRERAAAERGGGLVEVGDTMRDGAGDGPASGDRSESASISAAECEPSRTGSESWSTSQACRPDAPSSFWRDPDWLYCRDGRWRPVESGTFPLAHGAPARMGRLRGYGNAICAPTAEAFIRAYCEVSVPFVA